MASETLYFVLSFALVIGWVLHLINLRHVKLYGKNVYGQTYTSGSIEHRTFKKLMSAKALAITGLIGLALVANLAYDVYRILHLGKPAYAQFILIYFSLGMILFSVIMFIIVRDKMAKVFKK